MKIRMKIDVSGSRNGVPWPPRGGVLDLPDAEGAALCAMGGAEPVEDDDVETAVPDDDTEKRALTTETAAAVTPNEPTAEQPPAPAKKTAPVKKTAAPAKKAAASTPPADSK